MNAAVASSDKRIHNLYDLDSEINSQRHTIGGND